RQSRERRRGSGASEREPHAGARRNAGTADVTRVIKVGGRPQSDPALAASISTAWSNARGEMVVVHGGGDELTSLQKALGSQSTFVNGRRVTTETDIDLVRMVLSGSANKRLVAALGQHGVQAVGVSGEDAALIAATPIDAEALGFVGAPSTINAAF